MSNPFVAEIRIFAGNFAPTGWATCDGQLLPISQNTALFSLLGTFYGGDGKSTFALPNLQGSAPMHQGDGPGLTQRFLGEVGGSDSITLIDSETPAHNHFLMASPTASDGAPINDGGLGRPVGGNVYHSPQSLAAMNVQALAPFGSSFPHNNMQPFLTLTFIIAMQGVFPARN